MDSDVPRQRIFEHPKCGGQTAIAGKPFEAICNPLERVGQLECDRCQRRISLGELVWADTGETIADYRRRLRRQSPTLLLVWAFGLGFVGGAVVGGLIGYGLALILSNAQSGLAVGMGAGAIGGAMISDAVGCRFLQRMYGIDYWRMK